jgi:hypothetical protein
MIAVLSFQKRVSVITLTLIKSVGGVWHVLLVSLILACVFVIWGNLVVGWRIHEVSTLNGAFQVRYKPRQSLLQQCWSMSACLHSSDQNAWPTMVNDIACPPFP